MGAEPALHQILVNSSAGVHEVEKRLLANGIVEWEVIRTPPNSHYPNRVKFYAPFDFDLSFLRPDILPPKDYVG
jgi:hypothetical protein